MDPWARGRFPGAPMAARPSDPPPLLGEEGAQARMEPPPWGKDRRREENLGVWDPDSNTLWWGQEAIDTRSYIMLNRRKTPAWEDENGQLEAGDWEWQCPVCAHYGENVTNFCERYKCHRCRAARQAAELATGGAFWVWVSERFRRAHHSRHGGERRRSVSRSRRREWAPEEPLERPIEQEEQQGGQGLVEQPPPTPDGSWAGKHSHPTPAAADNLGVKEADSPPHKPDDEAPSPAAAWGGGHSYQERSNYWKKSEREGHYSRERSSWQNAETDTPARSGWSGRRWGAHAYVQWNDRPNSCTAEPHSPPVAGAAEEHTGGTPLGSPRASPGAQPRGQRAQPEAQREAHAALPPEASEIPPTYGPFCGFSIITGSGNQELRSRLTDPLLELLDRILMVLFCSLPHWVGGGKADEDARHDFGVNTVQVGAQVDMYRGRREEDYMNFDWSTMVDRLPMTAAQVRQTWGIFMNLNSIGNAIEMLVGVCYTAASRGAALTKGFIDWSARRKRAPDLTRSLFETGWFVCQQLGMGPLLNMDGSRKDGKQHGTVTHSDYRERYRLTRVGALNDWAWAEYFNTLKDMGVVVSQACKDSMIRCQGFTGALEDSPLIGGFGGEEVSPLTLARDEQNEAYSRLKDIQARIEGEKARADRSQNLYGLTRELGDVQRLIMDLEKKAH